MAGEKIPSVLQSSQKLISNYLELASIVQKDIEKIGDRGFPERVKLEMSRKSDSPKKRNNSKGISEEEYFLRAEKNIKHLNYMASKENFLSRFTSEDQSRIISVSSQSNEVFPEVNGKIYENIRRPRK